MRRSKRVLLLLATLAFALPANQSFAQTLTTLATFDGTDGAGPRGDVTVSGSNLYGAATFGGGAYGYGNIFSLPVTGGTPTVLANFNNANATYGANPQGSLTLSGSTLYGVTSGGGTNGWGTVVSIPTAGGTPTVLGTFNETNGGGPSGALTLSANGSTLYGMTYEGGAYGYQGLVNGYGTIFSIPVAGGPITTLLSFNGADGASPWGSLTLSANGSTLYGMTSQGGANNYGTVFSIPVNGGTPTTLASFNFTNGRDPMGNLTLIGTTLYGMTSHGGANNDGTVFSIPVTGGTPTVLFSFNGTNGEDPWGSLTLSANGSTLYGMTSQGGASNDGVIFSIPLTGGTPTTLLSFNGTNGEDPYGSLTLSGSTLYGMAQAGGAVGGGTVFALTLPEPTSVVLLGLGTIGLGAMTLRRKARKQAARKSGR